MTGKEFYFDRCKNSPCGEDKRIYKVHVDIRRPTTFIPHQIKNKFMFCIGLFSAENSLRIWRNEGLIKSVDFHVISRHLLHVK